MPNDPKKPQDEPEVDADDHGGSLARFFERIESDPDDNDPEGLASAFRLGQLIELPRHGPYR